MTKLRDIALSLAMHLPSKQEGEKVALPKLSVKEIFSIAGIV